MSSGQAATLTMNLQAPLPADADLLRKELHKMFNEDLDKNYKLDELDAFYTDFYPIADVYRHEVMQRVLQREEDRRQALPPDYFEPPEPYRTDEEQRELDEAERRTFPRVLRATGDWADKPRRRKKRKAG